MRADRGAALAAGLLAVTSSFACSGPTRKAALPPPAATITSPPAPPGPSSTATTSTTAPGCTTQAVIAGWSLTRRAEELVAAPIIGAEAAPLAAAMSQHVGGLLLLGSVPSGPVLASRLGEALAPVGAPLPLVMTDQEGGGVQRLGPDVTSLPWPRTMAQTLTPAEVGSLAARLGQQMKALHVNVDLAPVLDLDAGPGPSATDPDGSRSFSSDPAAAATYGRAFVQGLQAGGVLAVVKHFPGLGGATGNTDYGPASTPPIATLRAGGLVPFRAAIESGARAVMVANASVPGLTAEPASLSAAVITGLLRQSLGFTGLVLTDSLSAGAVQGAGFTVAAAAVAAVRAGADMVLFGSTLTPAQTALLAPAQLTSTIGSIVQGLTAAAAAGSLPMTRLDDAVAHVVAATGANLCPPGPADHG